MSDFRILENAMTYIPALNIAKVAIDQLFGQQSLANIIYFLKAGGWSVGTLAALCGKLETWWDTNLAPLMNDALSLVGITATDLSTSTGPSVTRDVSPAIPGEVTNAGAPANAAAVVTFRTAFRGRSARGRNYISGLSDSFAVVSPTAVGTGYADDLVAAYEALSSVEASQGVSHVVVSFYTEKAPRTEAQNLLVTSYTADTLIDSQRRRLAGRGI